MKTLTYQSELVLRKIQTNSQQLTARNEKGEVIQDLVFHFKAYKALARNRVSPPYFERVSKDLFVITMQLGPATFFLLLSATAYKNTRSSCRW